MRHLTPTRQVLLFYPFYRSAELKKRVTIEVLHAPAGVPRPLHS